MVSGTRLFSQMARVQAMATAWLQVASKDPCVEEVLSMKPAQTASGRSEACSWGLSA